MLTVNKSLLGGSHRCILVHSLNLKTWGHHFLSSHAPIHLAIAHCPAEHRTPVTSPSGKFQTLLPITYWYQSHQGKHNAVKHWMEQYFTHIERKQSKIRSNLGAGPPGPTGLSWQPMQGNSLICAYFVPHWEDPIPSSPKTDTSVGWPSIVCCWHLSRTKEHIVGLQQRKRFPHKMISPMQAVWVLICW